MRRLFVQVASTDNAIARFDSTTGKVIQNSAVTIDDNGLVTTGTTGGFVVTNGAAGKALWGQFAGFPLAGLYDDASDTQPSFALYTAGIAAFLGLSQASLVFGVGGTTAPDTALIRDSAGTLQILTGVSFADEGDLKLRDLTASGDCLVEGDFTVGDGASTGVVSSEGNFNIQIKTGNTTTGTITIIDGSNGEIILAPHGTGAIVIGNSSNQAVLESNGNQDLVLQTGNATTGVITITDGSNGDINLAPHGTGRVQAGAVNIPTVSSTDTLTNKRITSRIGTVASSATPTPSADTHDQYNVTALAVAATFAAPTGTPTNGQKIIIRIKDNGTARTLAWNAIYRAIGVTLPTTTVLSKTLYCGFVYNSADSKWDCIAVAQET